MSNYKPILSHAARRARQQQIADAVRGGEAPAAVAQRFGVVGPHVRVICRRMNVPWPGARAKRTVGVAK